VSSSIRPHRIFAALGLLALLGTAACSDDKEEDQAVPAAAATTSADLDGRSFSSTAVEGQTLVEGSTITLDFADGRVAANAGCNTLTGGYEIDGGDLSVDQLASTMMACEDDLQRQDEWLSEFLSAGPNVDLTDDALTLSSDDVTLTLTAG